MYLIAFDIKMFNNLFKSFNGILDDVRGLSYNGIAAPYNNAERQEYVNHKAEYKGASSGTAR